MTPCACLVNRQREVSPIKMNMGEAGLGGSFAPMSMFLWADQLLPQFQSSASNPVPDLSTGIP